jgi:hypothetical protein
LRRRPSAASFAIGLALLAIFPDTIGFQDLGALLARQPAVAKRWQQHLIASPFGTIHAATFSLPRPIGTSIPHPPIYALANFDPADITGSIGRQLLGDPMAPIQFPKPNRKAKRDSLVTRPRDPLPPLPPALAIESVPQAEVDASLKKDENARFDPYAQYEFVPAPDQRTATPDVDIPYADIPPANLTPTAPQNAPRKDAAQLFFGAESMAAGGGTIAPKIAPKIVPWAPGEAPVVLASRGDPDIKQSALSPSPSGDENKGGESVARLGLAGTGRAKAEKCLANAVYFEARGEPVRGQIAVAQVVINRVFSRFYPDTVCGVVYQNAHRRLACQFTFACDRHPDVVREPEAWERARKIATQTLDGRLWLPEVGKATHYHADWVRPWWARSMTKLHKLGVHIFYRPRKWGDGAEDPVWGDAKATAELVSKL